MPVRTLVVRCFDWPVVAVGVEPHETVAVVAHGRVVSASPAAAARGVRRGQRQREAVSCCDGLVVVGRDEHREARAFEPVVRVLEELTPWIEMRRPGVCVFGVRGPSRYFGGDEALAERVRADVDGVLDAMGWAGHLGVGVADGPFAADLAARACRGTGRGSVVVAPGGAPAFLAGLPVSALAGGGTGPDLVDIFERLGLRTLGDLAALEMADAVGRFGAEGRRAHMLASGDDPDAPLAAAPAPDMAVVARVDPPSDRVDVVAFSAKAAADEMCSHLADAGLASTRVAVRIETEHGERLERLWGHNRSFGPMDLVDRVRWQLDAWLTSPAASRPTGAVSSLELAPDVLVAAHGHQGGLWGERTEGSDERAVRALVRVQAMLGQDAVRVPERRAGRSPGEMVVAAPFMGVVRSSGSDQDVSRVRAAWPAALPDPAPAVVHAARRCADVCDVTGGRVGVSGRGLLGAVPRRISVDGGPWRDVEAWSAPWPLDERWWDAARHRRRARLQIVAGGTAYLLVIEGGRWWVEATYD